MSSGDSRWRHHEQKLRDAVDNYQATVLALKAFGNEILYDDATGALAPGVTAHCGRRLKTSAANRHSKNTAVTPDLVVRPTAECGVLAEAKLGFETDPGRFTARMDECVEQLEKYDDVLTGWPPCGPNKGEPTSHDIALLVNHEDDKRVANELRLRRDQQRLALTRNFALVSIARIQRSGGKYWPELDLLEGRLSDSAKTTKLSNRIQIRPEVLSQNPQFGLASLCDYEPPEPLMVELVFRAAFSQALRSADLRDRIRFDGAAEQTVTVDDVCQWIRDERLTFQAHDGRDATVPDPKWVTKAMNRLVAMKWAKAAMGKSQTFIFIHKTRRAPFEQFFRHTAKRLAREEEQAKAKAERAERAQQKRAQKKQETEARKEATKRRRDAQHHPLLADSILSGDLKPRQKPTAGRRGTRRGR